MPRTFLAAAIAAVTFLTAISTVNADPTTAPAATRPAEPQTAFLGVTTSDVPEILRTQLDLPKGFGMVIDSVEPGSPAEQAGLKKFDVLHKVNDQIVINHDQLAVLIGSYKPGDSIQITVIHQAKSTTLPIKLAAQPASAKPEHNDRHPGNAKPGEHPQRGAMPGAGFGPGAFGQRGGFAGGLSGMMSFNRRGFGQQPFARPAPQDQHDGHNRPQPKGFEDNRRPGFGPGAFGGRGMFQRPAFGNRAGFSPRAGRPQFPAFDRQQGAPRQNNFSDHGDFRGRGDNQGPANFHRGIDFSNSRNRFQQDDSARRGPGPRDRFDRSDDSDRPDNRRPGRDNMNRRGDDRDDSDSDTPEHGRPGRQHADGDRANSGNDHARGFSPRSQQGRSQRQDADQPSGHARGPGQRPQFRNGPPDDSRDDQQDDRPDRRNRPRADRSDDGPQDRRDNDSDRR